MACVPLYQVDAFTNRLFGGNPAAVCLLPFPVEDRVLQAVAAEMALSETAFLLRRDNRRWAAGDTFSLRWFTPQTEVTLCGHATLASAAVLFDVVKVAAPILTFETLSGDLLARKAEEGIALDFPLDPPEPCDPPAGVLEALGLTAESVEATAFGTSTLKLLLHLADESLLKALTPDFQSLVRSEGMASYRGLIVTAAGTGSYDFVSRFFAPWIGINEDPVTGSAHTVLTPYWAARLGKRNMRASQASARGGELRVSMLDNGRVQLAGQAAHVLEGYLSLPAC